MDALGSVPDQRRPDPLHHLGRVVTHTLLDTVVDWVFFGTMGLGILAMIVLAIGCAIDPTPLYSCSCPRTPYLYMMPCGKSIVPITYWRKTCSCP